MPIRTKKTGTRNDGDRLDQMLPAPVRPARRSRGSAPFPGSGRRRKRRRSAPAPRWRRGTRAAKQKLSAIASSTPVTAEPRGDAEEPRRESEPQYQRSEKEAARTCRRPTAHAPDDRCCPVSAAVMIPPTTARMTSPRTSSITAAPRMTRASADCERPRSLQHARRDADARRSERCSQKGVDVDAAIGQKQRAYAPAKRERARRRRAAATSSEGSPTFIMSRTVDSSPTSKSRMMTPSSRRCRSVASFLMLSNQLNAEEMEVAEHHPGHELPEDAGLAGSQTRDRRRAWQRRG